MRAASVIGSTATLLVESPGSTPRAALHVPAQHHPKEVAVKPIPATAARDVCVLHHYLGTYPAGAQLTFGIFVGDSLMGVAVLGVGPTNGYRILRGAEQGDVLCLSRLWLDDRLGCNSESRVLGIILRNLRRNQSTAKAVIAYSDPAVGHTGIIYRAAGFLYLGASDATPQYRLPDGSLHHGRTLGHQLGTRSLRHLAANGLQVERVPKVAKHIYISLLDPTWREQLTRPVVPYPSQEHA